MDQVIPVLQILLAASLLMDPMYVETRSFPAGFRKSAPQGLGNEVHGFICSFVQYSTVNGSLSTLKTTSSIRAGICSTLAVRSLVFPHWLTGEIHAARID
jgi:hypothetical protein